jgi:two-component system sensor histidine kinase UhpB
MQTLLEETSLQIRDIMADLHPPALDDYGLFAALRTYVESMSGRCAAPISVLGADLAPRLPLIAESALLRIAQGALVNAITHARAQAIQVVLAATPERVTLTIADDGVGFDPVHAPAAQAHWGLTVMRERANAVGATLLIDSVPEHGTRVVVEIGRE